MLPSVDELIREYYPLAQSLAQQVWRTAPHALELDEMRGIANLGLVTAANRWVPFCEAKGHDPHQLQFFKPYVVRRVYGSLIDAIRASDWATRSLRTRAKALQEAGQDKGLSDHELARRTGMTVIEVRATIRGMAQRPMSLEGEELDPVAGATVESSAFTRFVLASVVDVIRTLPREEQAVLALHYFNGLQLQQVAKALGIPDSRASQLHAAAVLTVHQAMVKAAQHQEDTDTDAL